MNLTLAGLREYARLNLCDERCFQVYVQMIEPSIKTMVDSYFKDWQDIELWITAMVMKRKGIFKTKSVVIHLREDEDAPELVTSAKEYWKIKRSQFSNKTSFLLKENIIPQPIYDLLAYLAKIRNKVHDYNGILTEDERTLFAIAANLLYPLYVAETTDDKEMMIRTIENCTKNADKFLKIIKGDESTSKEGSVFVENTRPTRLNHVEDRKARL